MCQQIIRLSYGGNLVKYFRLEDMLLHLFFNSLDAEEAERFFREFECDENGRKIVKI